MSDKDNPNENASKSYMCKRPDTNLAVIELGKHAQVVEGIDGLFHDLFVLNDNSVSCGRR